MLILYGLRCIRSRLAGSEGRLYWRSLERAGRHARSSASTCTASFPSRPRSGTIRRAAAQFLKLMGASLALAGVGACTKQPPEEDRSVRPAARGPRPRPAAVLRHRDPVRRRRAARAGRKPHGPSDQDRRESGASGQPGRHRLFTQAADPRPLRPGSLADRDRIAAKSRPWGDVPDRDAGGARRAQKAQQGAGLRFLTEPITSPSLAEQMATILAGLSAGASGISGIRSPATARGRRAAAPARRRRSTTSTRPTSSSRSTPTSSAAGPAMRALHAATSPTAAASTDDAQGR